LVLQLQLDTLEKNMTRNKENGKKVRF
jgi:hypothetical protein